MDPNNPHEPGHWAFWMRVIRYMTALAALGLMALSVRAFYPPARNGHLLRMAKVFIDNKNLRAATLSLQQVMVSDPRNLNAVKMMADLAEVTGSPQTLIWRKRVCEIAPEAFGYRVEWIKSALKMGETALAAEGLATIDEAGRRTAAFHHLAASIAIAWSQLPEAEEHAALALQKEPENDGYKFNLALIWMQADDELRHSKGLEMMASLSEHSEFRYRALRGMIDEALRGKKTNDAVKVSWDLQAEPQSTLDDRIRHLDLLAQTKDSKLDEFLGSIQIAVANNPEDALSVALWMIQHRKAKEALAWTTGLPATQQNRAPIRMAEAESYAGIGDWNELEKFLGNGDWRNFDFLRRAYLARISRARGQKEGFVEQWDGAIRQAGGKTGPLSMLNRLARQWGWGKESDDLLWDVAAGGFNNRWALESLYEKFEKAGDSRALYQVVLRMLEIKPNDVVARNNFALLSMLMNVRVEQAHTVARSLFNEFPQNSIILSTYAYSLSVQGKHRAAFNVFQALKEEQLAEPSVAAYYSLILEANGEHEKARKYAAWAAKASLLPEERALLAKVI